MKKRFIFDENYIKRYAKKDKIKWLVIGACALVLIIVIIIVILANRKPDNPNLPVTPVFELKEELVIESGSEIPEVVDYFTKLENVDINDIKVTYPEEFEVSYDTSLCSVAEIEEMEESSDINYEQYDCVDTILKAPATYGITILLLEKEYTVKLTVVDTAAPVILTKNLEIYQSESYKIDDFVQLCFDVNDECSLSYVETDTDKDGNVIDYSKYTDVGTHKIRLIAKDQYGNISEPVETTLTIIEPDSPLYTVTFNSNGGSAVESVLVEENKLITEPVSPTKEGYTFEGWYVNNQKFDFSTPVTRNIILVAKWKKVQDNPNEEGTGTIDVSNVSINYKTIYLYVGDTKTVTATVTPTNATNKTVSWKSNNTSIATVNGGKITGLKVGTTTITATAGGKSGQVTVVVKEKGGGNSCAYGDTSYNTSKYILSVNLTKNNCAVNPNATYNETISSADYTKLNKDLSNLGFQMLSDTFSYKTSYINVKNNSGNGLVGYQITVYVKVKSVDGSSWLSAEYIINSDGSRKFLNNNICSSSGCLK